MNALRFDRDTGLQLIQQPTPDREGEALVRVKLAGICSTDLHITRGYASYSGTLGHEFVGVVEHSPVKTQIGCRVVGEINAGCGRCDLCREGDARHCANRTVLGIHGRDGTFAEFLNLPAQNLLEVPEDISDEAAVFCEPLAAACQILEQEALKKHDHVAVIGDGKLGQLVSRVLATVNPNVLLIGKHTEKLEHARAAGIRTELGSNPDLPSRSFDYVIECSGSPSGLSAALKLVRPKGTIILKSTFHGEVMLETWPIVVDEIIVRGSRCGRFKPALEMLSKQTVKPEDLISEVYDLADGVKAMQRAQQPGTLKILLKVS